MQVRLLELRDVPRVKEIFARQGFEYEFPNLRGMASAMVLEDEGVIVNAVLARPTIELYFLGDQEWRTPQWRMEALKQIHEAMRKELHGKGFEDAHVWIPPEKKSFVSRLMRSFGWTRPLWTNLTRSTAPRSA